MVKFIFATRNYENNLFCNNFQSPGGLAPPSDAHGYRTTIDLEPKIRTGQNSIFLPKIKQFVV